MDLHNNEIGRIVAKENPNASVLELANSLLNKLSDGEMITLDSNGNITKSTLTDKQKSKVLENLKKQNDKEEEKNKYNYY